MNEADTRAEHIDPALKAAGWGVVEGSRLLWGSTHHAWPHRRLGAEVETADRRLCAGLSQLQARRH